MNQLTNLSQIGAAIAADPHKHCTKDPIFCVQVKVREYGYDPQWTDETVYIDLEGDCEEVSSLEVAEAISRDEIPDSWEKTGFKDRWQTVQVFFTEHSANAYIETQGHRHRGELRVFVDSLYRNEEMQAIRNHLIELASKEAPK